MKLQELKGIGEKTEQLYRKLGIETVSQLLFYFPRNYDEYGEPITIAEIDNEAMPALSLKIHTMPVLKKIRNLQILTCQGIDKNGDKITLTWFNMPYLKNQLLLEQHKIVRGKVKRKYAAITMEQPELYEEAAYQEKLHTMQPIYTLTRGLTSNMIKKAVKAAFETIKISEFLPYSLREKNQLVDLDFACKKMHFPKNFEELALARRRLAFDEFFLFIYIVKQLKEENLRQKNTFSITHKPQTEQFIESLPYTLTDGQRFAWEDIKRDFLKSTTMNRLIQGDVGSGKTIIAILALFDTALSGYQAAMMAPTEILARQHWEEIQRWIEEKNLPITVALLTGAMTAKEKREVYEKIASQEVHIIIGTHALIQEKVKFHSLALVITDEQHRFGVRQREVLSQKGSFPHILVMSATPIPRTLAIILYGDLDISRIEERPKNRLPIKNCVIHADDRNKAYDFIKQQVAQGRQAYVICPLVEESDGLEAENVVDYTKKLREIFPDAVSIEYLHGKMKPKQKNDIMMRFAQNQIQILVSTTVIEVGINVVNATVMLIENAERFGLAGLHQLRGRVGRGQYQSYCIFVSTSAKKETMKRLDILNHSNDGFLIAQEDLKLRGPGDFLGIRQSGDFQFQIADIYTDAALMEQAAKSVDEFIEGTLTCTEEEERLLLEKINEFGEESSKKINL